MQAVQEHQNRLSCFFWAARLVRREELSARQPSSCAAQQGRPEGMGWGSLGGDALEEGASVNQIPRGIRLSQEPVSLKGCRAWDVRVCVLT